ncbi:hypothetical protein AVEN_197950-1 [Araneus ventricosus]|uniref:Reverse transcriptase domain-containing protein n=1 Tax=Araneus ventricosus TaxID=182803 RepID=A0A4Y2MBM3_ARAVE|nr:hypothetical protein AVEN_197950-1 [Araneus ventricosus]
MSHPESSVLTTFLTPFGRFKFKRLPIGISSAPEEFQQRIREYLKGRDIGLMDEFVVYGETKQQPIKNYQKFGKLIKRMECVLSRLSLLDNGWSGIWLSVINKTPKKIRNIC